jgi:hypothetical protein
MTSDATVLRREALILDAQTEIDPENNLDPRERRRQAEVAVRDHYRALGKRSGHARRLRAARLAAYEAAALGGER